MTAHRLCAGEVGHPTAMLCQHTSSLLAVLHCMLCSVCRQVTAFRLFAHPASVVWLQKLAGFELAVSMHVA